MPSLLDLPTELLTEVVKDYPQLYTYDVDALVFGVRSRQFASSKALRALSQTCRRLRDISLPILWACIYAGPLGIENFWPNNKGGRTLERRMKGILKTAYVAPYINSLSVNLDECDMNNAQPISRFIRVLRLLPNLRTLTIIGVPGPMNSILIASCEGHSFPSIITLAITDELATILPCFPNLQTLTNAPGNHMYFGNGERLIQAAAACSAQIHTINMISSRKGVECG
ncbi:hypothetical protein DFH06DRAFT_1005363 [Mycena polygramma]|nr:hypothetical protein DFH06DRAFT_1005363 [Mycena polygramma]